MNAKGERLGEANLRACLLRAGPGAAASGDEVVHTIGQHVAERPQFDDITLVCLARNE
jgi:serine phosphatase RsbU (regulator of sigma subunit)